MSKYSDLSARKDALLKELQEIDEAMRPDPWPTARYVLGHVVTDSSDEGQGLWALDEQEGTYVLAGSRDWVAEEWFSHFTSATPVSLVPSKELDDLLDIFTTMQQHVDTQTFKEFISRMLMFKEAVQRIDVEYG